MGGTLTLHPFPPFASTFTKYNTTNCFRRVGYVPFTRECLNSNYIRHELAEDIVNSTLNSMVAEYEISKVRLKKELFKVEGMFYAEIKIATTIRREKEDKDQVKALVNRKGTFSASAIYTN